MISLGGLLIISRETDVPMMIGEFLDTNNERYVMVVDLSLQTLASFSLKTDTVDELMYSVCLGEDKPILCDFEASK